MWMTGTFKEKREDLGKRGWIGIPLMFTLRRPWQGWSRLLEMHEENLPSQILGVHTGTLPLALATDSSHCLCYLVL